MLAKAEAARGRRDPVISESEEINIIIAKLVTVKPIIWRRESLDQKCNRTTITHFIQYDVNERGEKRAKKK